MSSIYAVERLGALIDQYMASRSRPGLVSTKAAAAALSNDMLACPVTGRALEDAIARSAVAHGHAVLFDFSDLNQKRSRWDRGRGRSAVANATRLTIRYRPGP
ncbi:MAG: hypothetical protein ABWZ57_15590 [Mesorhizobium sp.]|jgi:hypothetical protein